MHNDDIAGLVNMLGPDYLSYMGAGGNYAGLIGYKGPKNPFNKEGRMAKITAMSQGREFDLQIDNNGADPVEEEIYLVPSMQVAETENGHPISGKAVSGNALTMTSSSGPTSALALKTFYRFIEQNPSLILAIRISSTDKNQLSKTILITTGISPYLASYPTRKLNIQSYVDENNQQRDIATIDQMLTANPQTQIKLPIPAGAVTNITFFMGPHANLAEALRNRAIMERADD